jgi:ribosomal-protein-alanine N-acetyltransferase
VIGALGPADLPGVVALEALAFPDAPWDADVMADEARHGTVMVWRDGDQVLGAIVYRVVPGELGDELDLHRVAVLPAARRGGIGRRLVEHMLAAGRARGLVRVTLEVRRDNAPAIALYERLGFTLLATRKRYYADGEDALVLVRGLG